MKQWPDFNGDGDLPVGIIFWIRRMAAMGGEEAALEHCEIKRDKRKRGIVEVVTDA